jgi:hypothetical protein
MGCMKPGWALILALLSAAPAAAQPAPAAPPAPQPSACASREHRQFDFWLGAWDVYPAGSNKMIAHSLIQSLYGGCGIRENWMPLGGEGGGSLNNYDTPSGKWHQSWIDSAGTRVDYEGGLVGDRMVFTGEPKSGPNAGKGLQMRMTFTPVPNGNVRQLGEQSADGGQSWQPLYDFIYKSAQ